MPNHLLKVSILALAVAGLAAAPAGALQQDSQRARPLAAKVVTPANERKYQITASDGNIVPGHIKVKLGQRVRITFVSRDDTYGLRIKDFGVKEKLTPERPVVVELIPQTVGTFEFRCTRQWGVKRFTKNGAIVVE